MSIHNKLEFRKICGLSSKHFSTYLKRGKIVVGDDGKLDDANPINQEFIKRHADRKQVASKGASKKAKAPADPEPGTGEKTNTLYELDKEQKALNIEKQRKEAAILDARIKKLNGELIPTDLVKLTIAQIFRGFTVELKQEFDKVVTDIAKKAHFNGNQVAELRGIVAKSINTSVQRGVESSKKNIQNIISEYSANKKAA